MPSIGPWIPKVHEHVHGLIYVELELVRFVPYHKISNRTVSSLLSIPELDGVETNWEAKRIIINTALFPLSSESELHAVNKE